VFFFSFEGVLKIMLKISHLRVKVIIPLMD